MNVPSLSNIAVLKDVNKYNAELFSISLSNRHKCRDNDSIIAR